MGGNESRSAQILRYVESEWQQLGVVDRNIPLLRNRQTDQQAELHSISLDLKQDIHQQYNIYNYRRKQHNALVGIYAAQQMQNQQSRLCGNQRIVKVLTEHIPARCSQLPQLSFEESVYLLSQSLTGFNQCYQTMGPFQVTPEMIGINSEGQVKVWLNQEFPKNHPLFQRPKLQMTVHGQKNAYYGRSNQSPQAKMVREVFGIVEKKCGDGSFPVDFKSRVQDRPTFQEAYLEIEQYCGAKKMAVPDRLNLSSQGSRQPNILEVNSNASDDFYNYEPKPAVRVSQPNLPQLVPFSPPPPQKLYHQMQSVPQYNQARTSQRYQPLSSVPQYHSTIPSSPRMTGSPGNFNFNYSTPQSPSNFTYAHR